MDKLAKLVQDVGILWEKYHVMYLNGMLSTFAYCLAVLLMGYAEKIAQVDLSGAQADLSRFPDGDQVSDWARTEMSAAVALGLINGVPIDGRDYLCPQDSATREQVATILMRFVQNCRAESA